mmetsp:Transcript_47475/g.53908  ORF Transcript_47475/g.53908 Transcript_47475/m.53908 type:complete len:103 (-) Transcript_47475:313-621(-)
MPGSKPDSWIAYGIPTIPAPTIALTKLDEQPTMVDLCSSPICACAASSASVSVSDSLDEDNVDDDCDCKGNDVADLEECDNDDDNPPRALEDERRFLVGATL